MNIKGVLGDVPKVSLVLRRGVVNLLIYFNRDERRYVSTGVSVDKEHWSDGLVVGRKDANKINVQLLMRVEEVRRQLIAMSVNGEELSAYAYDSGVKLEKAQRESFIAYMERRIGERKLSDNTKRNHRVSLAALKRFGKIVSFASLTPANLRRFDEFLRRESDRCNMTVHGIHKGVKVYVYECLREGLIRDNPYLQFRYDRGRHKDRHPLREDMIVKIRDAELVGKYRKTRDLFVLMCYTGLSYVDMQMLRREDCVERDGNMYIRATREKTGERYYTPVLPAARSILEKYDYKVPMISNQKMNKYLHDIERLLDIPVSLTCHVARHSFATLMLSKDVPIPVVAKMLGHSSTKTTEVYAKVLAENVEEKSVMVIDKLL